MFDTPDFDEQRKAMVASAHEQRLRHDRFVDELTKEQLATFIELLQCFDGENGSGYSNFMMGRAAAVMQYKHNACPGCGEDHMSIASLDDTRAEMGLAPLNDNITRVDGALAFDEIPPVEDPEADLLREYGMVRVDGQLKCAGCGLSSVSMDDRMLRAPKEDGCSGCQSKSAFG